MAPASAPSRASIASSAACNSDNAARAMVVVNSRVFDQLELRLTKTSQKAFVSLSCRTTKGLCRRRPRERDRRTSGTSDLTVGVLVTVLS